MTNAKLFLLINNNSSYRTLFGAFRRKRKSEQISCFENIFPLLRKMFIVLHMMVCMMYLNKCNEIMQRVRWEHRSVTIRKSLQKDQPTDMRVQREVPITLPTHCFAKVSVNVLVTCSGYNTCNLSTSHIH